MKLTGLVSAAAMGLLSGAILTAPAVAAPTVARNAEKAKAPSKEAAKASPGLLQKRLALAPKGLQFGIGLKQISAFYAKVFEKELLPRYREASPGPETAALDLELRNRRRLISRHYIKFGDRPTGLDQGALKTEYSYRNGESMTRLPSGSGKMRYFFFFDDKLWKVYDEYKLGQGRSLGENFEAAVKKLSVKLGAPPIKHEADPEHGRSFEEARWSGHGLLIRAVNREHEQRVGVVYVDKSVYDRLAKYRKNKPVNHHALDPAVLAATQAPAKKKPSDDKQADKKGKQK